MSDKKRKKQGLSSSKYGFVIEYLDDDNRVTGLGFNPRDGGSYPVSDMRVSFPTFDAAEAYANEFGFELGIEVEITMHKWVDPL